jgi:replicative DNA helicase
MDTKLTLKLNKKSIENAKRYARKQNQSLSSLVEDYFNLISGRKNEQENQNEIEISPNVLELSGIIKLNKDFNLKEEYGNHLSEKYG